MTRFGRPELGEKTDRTFSVARLTPASRARFETVSAPSVRSGRPSSSRAVAARNAARSLRRARSCTALYQGCNEPALAFVVARDGVATATAAASANGLRPRKRTAALHNE
ncbi:hypothetical protein ABIA14_005477 [Sinorhizobium fredii]|nr:hypothetical protein AOX55_00005374 [Sinorhizobium fredii CCBAU 25509]